MLVTALFHGVVLKSVDILPNPDSYDSDPGVSTISRCLIIVLIGCSMAMDGICISVLRIIGFCIHRKSWTITRSDMK